MKINIKAYGFVCILCVSASLMAQTTAPKNNDTALKAEAKKLAAAWGHDPVLVAAVKEQNAKKTPLVEIQAVDKDWMDNKDQLSAQILARPCSTHLKQLVAASNGKYNETFVMDEQGANVCMSNRTSDYWQGDEAKWQKSYNDGMGGTFIDERRIDASAHAVLVQVSFPVADGNKVIGAITVGIDPEKLSAQK